MTQPLKAWRVWVPGWPESECFAFAPTETAARHEAQLGATEAGYDVAYFDWRARRAGHLDGAKTRRSCVALEYEAQLMRLVGAANGE